ncbi:MAG: hypothetical protein ABSC94_07025 [Polyangiaceae bacterium]
MPKKHAHDIERQPSAEATSPTGRGARATFLMNGAMDGSLYPDPDAANTRIRAHLEQLSVHLAPRPSALFSGGFVPHRLTPRRPATEPSSPMGRAKTPRRAAALKGHGVALGSGIAW